MSWVLANSILQVLWGSIRSFCVSFFTSGETFECAVVWAPSSNPIEIAPNTAGFLPCWVLTVSIVRILQGLVHVASAALRSGYVLLVISELRIWGCRWESRDWSSVSPALDSLLSETSWVQVVVVPCWKLALHIHCTFYTLSTGCRCGLWRPDSTHSRQVSGVCVSSSENNSSDYEVPMAPSNSQVLMETVPLASQGMWTV